MECFSLGPTGRIVGICPPSVADAARRGGQRLCRAGRIVKGGEGALQMTLRVVAAAARSGKTSRLLCAYRQRVAEGPPGSVLWLAPTHRAVADVIARLVADGLAGCLHPNLLSFDQMAARVLSAAALRMRPLSPAVVRSILGRIVDRARGAGRLAYFAPIAPMPGFLDLLVAYVGEMKRLEIWPEELAAAWGPRAAAKDRELCELYGSYQELLTAHDLYDRQGQFWAARRLLREGQWGPLAGVRHVFVDGFTDFTRTEHEVLELLAQRADSLTISLTLESASPRSDLFTKTERTLEALRQRHPRLEVDYLPTCAQPVPALAHLERHLFGNPSEAEPVADATGIEIVAAAGVTHEVELLAERIKGLLVGGDGRPPVSAADILVVFRSLADVAPLVREVFARFGIPCVVAAAPRLETSPLVAALLAWLRLDVDDWPFRQVLATLGHNLFRPAWPHWQQAKAAAALESVVRELEFPSSRRALVAGVERLAQRAAEALGEKRRLSRRTVAAHLAAPLLRRLCEAFDRLPQQATAGEWAGALAEFARELGMLQASDAELAPEAAADERQAWERLLAALAEADRVSRWMGERAGVLSRRDLLAALQDLARSEEMPLARDETGCVRVLSAESARNLAAPYVFVAGLSEKAFPPSQREDCLSSDADARRLIESGLPLASHALRSRYEMLLFYEIVTRATRRLVLSYPALDAAAQPLVASPYLSEVEQACSRDRIPRNAEPHLSAVPPSDEVRSVRDLRVRAVSRRWQVTRHCWPTLARCRTVAKRPRTSWPGCARPRRVFTSRATGRTRACWRRRPRRASWPSDLVRPAAGVPANWSSTRIARFNSSWPVCSACRRSASRSWPSTTWSGGGSCIGCCRRRIANGTSAPAGRARPSTTRPRASARSCASWSRSCAASGGDALANGLAEIDLRKLARWFEGYVRQHADYDEQWADWAAPPRPAHFEVAFGPRHRDDPAGEPGQLPDDSDPLSTLEPVEMDCGGETIRFAGRIDRIDVGRVAGEVVFTIVDYKSGSVSRKTSLQAVLGGQSLQPWVYALAAERLLADRGARPFARPIGTSRVKVIRRRRRSSSASSPTGGSKSATSGRPSKARSKPASARSWPESARGNSRCTARTTNARAAVPISTVCRVNQARSAGKQWQPPGEPAP